jgi:hypothetical protein
MEMNNFKPPIFIPPGSRQTSVQQQPLIGGRDSSYDPEVGTANKSCSKKQALCKIGGYTVGAMVLFGAGYLVNHFVPIPVIDNWLNSLQGNNQNLIDKQIYACDPVNYGANDTMYDVLNDVVGTAATSVYNLVTGNDTKS